MKNIFIIIFILIGLFLEAKSKEPKKSEESKNYIILGSIELTYPLLGKSKKNKGKIVFKDVKISRNELEGGDDPTLLEDDNYYRASWPIASVIYNMVYEALNYSGFEVIYEQDNKNPVLVIEILDFYIDGYIVYGAHSIFRVSLYTPDMSKILYTKDISANSIIIGDKISQFEIACNKVLKNQMMNILSIVDGNVFHESYKGKEYKAKNYTLDFERKKIKNIPSDIQNPEYIKDLSLYKNSIKNLNGLEKFTDLEYLNLTKNDIKKIENINNPNLLSLYLNSCKITKIENLDKLKNLEMLNLSNNNISKIEGLDNLVNLKMLDLSNTKINKIENLDKLTNLVGLDLSGTKINKLENIDNLKNLKCLSLVECESLKKLENLDKLTNLTYLDLSNNIYGFNLDKIENLDKLVNLQYLNLRHNSLDKIENLDDLVNLRRLDLSFCDLSKIEGLNNLANLEELYICSYIQLVCITKIEGLDNLINLQVLDLTGNDIKRIENIEKLKNLEILFLSWNFVKSISSESYLFIKENIKHFDIDYYIKRYHIKIDKPKKNK